MTVVLGVDGGSAETKEDVTEAAGIGTSTMKLRQYWMAEIDMALRSWSDFHKEAEQAIMDYRGDGTSNVMRSGNSSSRETNVVWSHVETVKPAIFQRMPKVVIERRHKVKNDLYRTVAMVSQEAAQFAIDDGDARSSVELARDDYLIAGLGQVKVRPVTHFDDDGHDHEDDQMDGSTTTIGHNGGPPMDVDILFQTIAFDHVNWADFLCSEGAWVNKRWVAFRSRMDRHELVTRFGEEIGNGVALSIKSSTHSEDHMATLDDDVKEMFARAAVWEIWDRREREVIWVTDGYPDILDREPDPLNLRGFFPCPEPMTVVKTSTKMMPRPESEIYAAQANQITELTRRIYSLTSKIKAVGAYAGADKNVLSKLLSLDDGQLVPVEDAMALADKGGLKGSIWFAPIKEMAEVLNILVVARREANQELHLQTGISDIVRGQGDASSTATESRVKAQFASMRLDERKRRFAQFVLDIVGISVELIAEHFEVESLKDASSSELPDTRQQVMDAAAAEFQRGLAGIHQQAAQARATALRDGDAQGAYAAMQQAQQAAQQLGEKIKQKAAETITWEDVMKVLRSDFLRAYIVQIDTDETIEVDRQAEKQARIEFITALVQLLQVLLPAKAEGSIDAELAGQILMFSVRGFSAARPIEDVIERIMQDDEEQKQAAQADPEAAQAQAELAKAQADGQVKMMIEKMKGELATMLQEQKLSHETKENDKDRQLELLLAKLDGMSKQMDAAQSAREKSLDRAHETNEADKDRVVDVTKAGSAEQERREEAEAQRNHDHAERTEDRKAAAKAAAQKPKPTTNKDAKK